MPWPARRRTLSATSGTVHTAFLAARPARTPPGPLADAAAQLCRELEVDRISVAATGDDHFTIVAHAGRGILAAGTTLPLATSTQILAAAGGCAWSCGDFRREPAWAEPTDRLMLALGFRSGASLPLADDDGRVRGVVSASFLRRQGTSGRRLDALRNAVPLLGRLLGQTPGAPPRRPAILVCVADEVAAQGIARLAERAGGVVVGTPRTLPTAVAHAASGIAVLVLDTRFDGQTAASVAAAVRAAGPVGAVVLAPAADRAGVRRAADAAGAVYAPRDAGSVALLEAIAHAVAAAHPAPRRRELAPPALTPREQQLLVHLERGVPFKQAAMALGIAESTSRWYARGLFRKLGATSRGDAVHRARRLGLL